MDPCCIALYMLPLDQMIDSTLLYFCINCGMPSICFSELSVLVVLCLVPVLLFVYTFFVVHCDSVLLFSDVLFSFISEKLFI